MNPEPKRNIPEYHDLPGPLKNQYTENEYAWMSDDQRATLEEDECLPED